MFVWFLFPQFRCIKTSMEVLQEKRRKQREKQTSKSRMDTCFVLSHALNRFWNVARVLLLVHPEMTIYRWQDVKIQSLTNLSYFLCQRLWFCCMCFCRSVLTSELKWVKICKLPFPSFVFGLSSHALVILLAGFLPTADKLLHMLNDICSSVWFVLNQLLASYTPSWPLFSTGCLQ